MPAGLMLRETLKREKRMEKMMHLPLVPGGPGERHKAAGLQIFDNLVANDGQYDHQNMVLKRRVDLYF
ncbi:unnamed protein product [Musa acuminata subsp. malaccensis]|uniref:(wild Malaysian banana) hypothetical protein n=1 Tax=Musa acuminata subsp. malaccensis TaxID=214687 RepID=A0A804I5Z8_MUSAM|nr:unnamed protein product [Musa acuminata subsp. malaccensis]